MHNNNMCEDRSILTIAKLFSTEHRLYPMILPIACSIHLLFYANDCTNLEASLACNLRSDWSNLSAAWLNWLKSQIPNQDHPGV